MSARVSALNLGAELVKELFLKTANENLNEPSHYVDCTFLGHQDQPQNGHMAYSTYQRLGRHSGRDMQGQVILADWFRNQI